MITKMNIKKIILLVINFLIFFIIMNYIAGINNRTLSVYLPNPNHPIRCGIIGLIILIGVFLFIKSLLNVIFNKNNHKSKIKHKK